MLIVLHCYLKAFNYPISDFCWTAHWHRCLLLTIWSSSCHQLEEQLCRWHFHPHSITSGLVRLGVVGAVTPRFIYHHDEHWYWRTFCVSTPPL